MVITRPGCLSAVRSMLVSGMIVPMEDGNNSARHCPLHATESETFESETVVAGGTGVSDLVRNASCVGRPQFLSEAGKREIYGAALAIAETAGMRVEHPRALELLSKAGCSVVEDLVRIPPRLVEDARRTVPSRIAVHNRCGEMAMELGGYN